MIFIAENIGERYVVLAVVFRNKTHGDTADGLYGYTGIHEREAACAYGSHRRRTVGLKNIADNANRIGEVLVNNILQTAACKITMTDFSATNTALRTSFASRERREVVVEKETFGALNERLVNHLLIAFRTKGSGSESLRFTAGEDGASVRSWQRCYFAPNRTNLVVFTTIQTLAFIKDSTAHCFALNIVIITINKCIHNVSFYAERFCTLSHVFCFLLLEIVADGREHFFAMMLIGIARSSLSVCAIKAEFVEFFFEFGIIYFVAISAFLFLAVFFGHLVESSALELNRFVSSLDSIKHLAFRNFFHLAFYHVDGVHITGYHQLDICLIALIEAGVDNEFAIYACYAHFAHRAVKRNV